MSSDLVERRKVSSANNRNNDERWKAIATFRSRFGDLQLSNFKCLGQLGCGDLGKVYLAKLAGTEVLFAIKVINKEALDSDDQKIRAQTEIEVLRSIDHQYLPTLYAEFGSDNVSALVMEFCPGGDLDSNMQSYFSEGVARFYAAEVLLSLEYLHKTGIIYRDLKPKNVLLREDGHIMLSDFDLCLLVKSSPTSVDFKTYVEPGRIEPACLIETACKSPCSLATHLQKAKRQCLGCILRDDLCVSSFFSRELANQGCFLSRKLSNQSRLSALRSTWLLKLL